MPKKRKLLKIPQERERGMGPDSFHPVYTEEEWAFIKEMDRRKRVDKNPYPTAAEMLQWAKDFGYRKIANPSG